MHILYVINGFDPGGAEHGLLTLIQNNFFSDQKLTVMSFCKGKGGLADKISDLVGTENIIMIREEEVLSLKSLVQGGVCLFKYIQSHKPDTVVLSLKQANIVGRLALTLLPGIHCISFEHTAKYRGRRFEWIYKYLLWATSYRVNEIWADTQETLRQTRQYFMPVRKRRKTIVPLFFVKDDLPVKQKYTVDQTIRIVAAGRLIDIKNLDVLIKTVKELNIAGYDCCLDIYGDGPCFENMQQLINDLVLTKLVRLKGYKSDWSDFVSQYDLFVNASDTEGFCIVVAEAMARGLPVVATNIGGIRDYGVHNVNMIKVNDPTVSMIKSAIVELLASEELRRNLGEKARKDMRINFSSKAIKNASSKIFKTNNVLSIS